MNSLNIFDGIKNLVGSVKINIMLADIIWVNCKKSVDTLYLPTYGTNKKPGIVLNDSFWCLANNKIYKIGNNESNSFFATNIEPATNLSESELDSLKKLYKRYSIQKLKNQK